MESWLGMGYSSLRRFFRRPECPAQVKLIIGMTVWVAVVTTGVAHAQVTTNITASGLGTQVPPQPPQNGVYNITGGTRAGTTLFHSFGNFSVGAGDVANFLNNTQLPTSNILGRVTGGNLSSIYGTIQTTGFGSANLFLMNPAGFLFGPNATVNVGGMASFTSADYLRLADGVRFNAIPDATADALLSTAPVAAYGFLGSNPGAITVQGSQFTVTEGTGISLVGGNITIQSGTPDGGTAQPARLSAPNGTIQLASTASPGEFDAATLQALPNVEGASFTSFGSVSLAPGSNINISGQNTVAIRGGQFVLSVNDAVVSTADSVGPPESISLSPTSSIISSSAGLEPGPDVHIVAGNFQMNGASVQSLAVSEGAGGAIGISVERAELTNGAQIVSTTEGAGAGGSITIVASRSMSVSGFDAEGILTGIDPFGFGIILSGVATGTTSTGQGGNITVSTSEMLLENGGMLASVTSGGGGGGNILLNNVGALRLQNGGRIFSSSGAVDFDTGEIFGNGQGGDITVSASGPVSISGGSSDLGLLSAISSQTLTEKPGSKISVTASDISVTDGGAITSSGSGSGGPGNISLTATDTFTISGFSQDFFSNSIVASSRMPDSSGGLITVTAPSINVSDLGIVKTSGGGTLSLTGRTISVATGAGVESDGGASSSGKILLAAENTVSITGQAEDPSGPGAFIRSHVTNSMAGTTGASGVNGGIEIQARGFSISDGGRIESRTNPGGGGAIAIHADDSVTISDPLTIQALTIGGGPVGPITINAPMITLRNQATVSSTTVGDNDGGTIRLEGQTISLRERQWWQY
jgi:filamentous hemagglutinin family protein